MCPFCGDENPKNAVQCQHCGEVLDSDKTVQVDTGELRDIQRPALRKTEFANDVLYLYVAGAEGHAPIQHDSREMVILGRSSTNASKGLIDLSPYHAQTLGVSRQHACIDRADTGVGFTIEDLESANGTWLNGNRLKARQIHPLRSGDHVQLGELLIFVYYV